MITAFNILSFICVILALVMFCYDVFNIKAGENVLRHIVIIIGCTCWIFCIAYIVYVINLNCI